MKTKGTYKWIEFVRPRGYWIYSVEQVFGVYQWLVKTAIERSQHYQSGAVELLSMKPTCLNESRPDSIRSLDDLKMRFHYALLDNCNAPIVQKWRADFKIDINESVVIPFKHYVPFKGGKLCGKDVCEADIQKAIEGFFTATGNLKQSPNKYHKNMTEIRGGKISVTAKQISFDLLYAAPEERTTYWGRATTLATVDMDKEPFLDGLSRALIQLKEITKEEKR